MAILPRQWQSTSRTRFTNGCAQTIDMFQTRADFANNCVTNEFGETNEKFVDGLRGALVTSRRERRPSRSHYCVGGYPIETVRQAIHASAERDSLSITHLSSLLLPLSSLHHRLLLPRSLLPSLRCN